MVFFHIVFYFYKVDVNILLGYIACPVYLSVPWLIDVVGIINGVAPAVVNVHFEIEDIGAFASKEVVYSIVIGRKSIRDIEGVNACNDHTNLGGVETAAAIANGECYAIGSFLRIGIGRMAGIAGVGKGISEVAKIPEPGGVGGGVIGKINGWVLDTGGCRCGKAGSGNGQHIN